MPDERKRAPIAENKATVLQEITITPLPHPPTQTHNTTAHENHTHGLVHLKCP